MTHWCSSGSTDASCQSKIIGVAGSVPAPTILPLSVSSPSTGWQKLALSRFAAKQLRRAGMLVVAIWLH